MFNVRRRILTRATLALASALTLGACVVYEPAPAYPVYGHAPGYYVAPQPSFYFGYDGGRYDRRRHHHRHWRG